MRSMPSLGFVVAALLAVPHPCQAAKKQKQGDRIWIHPDVAAFKLDRIAMFPVATFDNNAKAERLLEGAFGQALSGTGYRWVSATGVRELLRAQTGGSDSTLKALKDALLKDPRIDSLIAPGLCERLHCDAILSVRVDLWEQRQIDWNESGKPATTIQLKSALVDSSGALLWSASGSQSLEGPYHDASTAPSAEGALTQRQALAQGAPDPLEVLTPTVGRWAQQFPSKKAAGAPKGPDSLKTDPPQPAPGTKP